MRLHLIYYAAVLWFSCNVFAVYAAERIISLAPHTTELAFAAGLGDKLVAVSEWSDYPKSAQTIERVASWQGINVERVMALKPDLILAWRGGNPQRILDQFSAAGMTVFYSDPRSIADIASDIRTLGSYAATPDQAIANADRLLHQAEQLRQRYHYSKAPNVMIQVSSHPLISSSATTLQSEILQLCGANNIFADSPTTWPQVSREQVVKQQPEAIIIGGSQDQAENVKQFWQPLLNVPIIALPDDWFYRSGPRVILAAEALCQQLSRSFPTVVESK